jgi:hypothetical protein
MRHAVSLCTWAMDIGDAPKLERASEERMGMLAVRGRVDAAIPLHTTSEGNPQPQFWR